MQLHTSKAVGQSQVRKQSNLSLITIALGPQR